MTFDLVLLAIIAALVAIVALERKRATRHDLFRRQQLTASRKEVRDLMLERLYADCYRRHIENELAATASDARGVIVAMRAAERLHAWQRERN